MIIELRERMFIPIEKLEDAFSFKLRSLPDRMGGCRFQASVFGRVIAELNESESFEEMGRWRNRVLHMFAQYSSTIILETRCGCTRRIEKPTMESDGVLVPLLIRDMPFDTRQAGPFEGVARREFKFDYRSFDDKTGLRIFREV